MDDWILAAAIAEFVAAGVYCYVGYRISQRTVPVEAQFASVQFTVWWYGIAADAGITALATLGGFSGTLSFPLGLTLDLLDVLVAVAALWGLVGYLTYVYTGRYHFLELGLFYFLFYAAVLYYEFYQNPYQISVSNGTFTLLYHGPTAPMALEAFVVLGLLVPEFLGAFLYLSLYRRAPDATRKFRIVMVGLSILIWFGAALFTPSDTVAWGVVKSLIEVGASLLSLVAYVPPRGIRERLHIAPLAPRSAGSGL